MGEKPTMKEIMEFELHKIHAYPKWRLYSVVPINLVETELTLLREAGVRTRKGTPVQRNNDIIAYKIEVLD